MSAQVQRPGTQQERPELEQLLADAAKAVAAMTPRERDSMWAAQKLSFMLGQKIPSEHDGPGRLAAEITSLQELLEALMHPEETGHHFGSDIRQLIDMDRQSLIGRVENFIRTTKDMLRQVDPYYPK